MASTENRFLRKLAELEQATTEEDQPKEPTKPENRFLAAERGLRPDIRQNRFYLAEQERDLGVVRSFTTGVKEGFLMPLNIFGREGTEVNRDETSEKVSGFLGELIGLGIGFVPFTVGTGMVLRGTGLVGGMSPAMFSVVRNTLAGTLQAVGTVEEVEDIPSAAAIGAGAGLAVELLFFNRALRGRAPDVKRGPNKVDTGSPIPDEMVPAETLNKEFAMTPAATDDAAKIQAKVAFLADDSQSYDDVLANLTANFEETAYIQNVPDVEDFVKRTLEIHPNAQVLVRPSGGRADVLIHNPLFDEARLSTKQIAQWKDKGVFEDLLVEYKKTNQLYRATGADVAEGKIQLESLSHPFRFAAPAAEVTIPTNPVVFNEAVQRSTRALAEIKNSVNIGFTMPASARGGQAGIRRGLVNTREYIRVNSLKDLLEEHIDKLSQIRASTPEEAMSILFGRMGVKGIIEVEEGITKRVRVFDQDTVSFVREPPRVSSPTAALDQVKLNQDGTIHSFVPSWKNGIIAPLRQAGYPEKEINLVLERYALDVNKRLVGIVDDEIRAMHNAAQLKWFGGCL